MSFEDVLASVNRWQTAVEALSALGAELTLRQQGVQAPPEIAAALRGVTDAAGLGDLDDLTPQQQMMAAAIVRLAISHAVDLLGEPARPAGWAYTDPVILEGWGRGSMMVPPIIAAAGPEFAEFTSVLDVGTGVGWLAVSAAGVWANAKIVGVDVWEPSLERARANVAEAGLVDRITLRNQNVVDLDDTDAFDCVWVPTFFLDEAAIEDALPALFRATRPGGWIVLGRFLPPPDPLAEATGVLRTIRGGGADLDTSRAIELLEKAGCTSVHAAPRVGPAPLELVVGQKPE
jgi:SAM-dependent methyltransferase